MKSHAERNIKETFCCFGLYFASIMNFANPKFPRRPITAKLRERGISPFPQKKHTYTSMIAVPG